MCHSLSASTWQNSNYSYSFEPRFTRGSSSTPTENHTVLTTALHIFLPACRMYAHCYSHCWHEFFSQAYFYIALLFARTIFTEAIQMSTVKKEQFFSFPFPHFSSEFVQNSPHIAPSLHRSIHELSRKRYFNFIYTILLYCWSCNSQFTCFYPVRCNLFRISV